MSRTRKLYVLAVCWGAACSHDVPTGERVLHADTAGVPGAAGSGSSFDNAPMAGAPAVAVSDNALKVHVEDGYQMTIEVITLACAGDCADIQAVAHGGNPPYTFAWDDGTHVAARQVCLDASKQLLVSVSDTAIQTGEFVQPAQTASAVVTANVLTCSDAGAPPATSDCSGDGSGNLIINGSFEMPVVAIGGAPIFSTGDTFEGWKVSGAPGNVAVLSGKFDGLFASFTPHSGAQTLDLTGNVSNSATGVEQSVATRAGRTYGLSFWIGNEDNSAYGTDSTANVLIDGVQVLSAKNSAATSMTDLNWQRFCVSFTAKSESTTIAIVNADSTTDNSNILDDVVVEAGP